MEWFKCGKCGERLDKPKLFYHFLICPDRNKKYVPEVQETVANGTSAVPKPENPQLDNDRNVGLSDQPPWDCSNTTLQKVKKAKLEPVVKGAKSKKTHHKAEKEVERDEADARKESGKEKVKWKKLIVSVLKAAPDGTLRMKKLHKLVLKRLGESGITVDDTDFSTILEHKVNSSSKFSVDGKYVRLAA